MSTIPPVSTPDVVKDSLLATAASGTNVSIPVSPSARPNKGKGIAGAIVEAVVTLGVLGGIGYAGWKYQANLLTWLEPILAKNKAPAARPPRITPVTTAKVRKRDMPLYLTGLGTVAAFKTVTLRSRVDGELKNVAFTEGQIVSENDLLAEIDPRQFEVQLAQAEGQLARDNAILKSAKMTLSRYEGLLASKSISAQEYDDQALLVQQTMASIQTDEATVANANLQLSYCKITAPITGRIGLRLVDQGNIVRANDPNGLAVITQLQPIAVVFTIPQDEISRVQRRTNQNEELKVDAFDRDFKVKLAGGKLLAVDNQVDATTGTVRIKAQFENEDNMLFPNQFVNARLLVDTRRDAVVVPSAAVQRGPASMFVYVVKVVDKEATVELRNVETGVSEGGETAIESGLEPNEVVVTDGLDKLQNGAKIVPRDKDAPNPDKSGKGEKKGGEKPEKKEAPRSTPPSAEGATPDTKSNTASNDSASREPGAQKEKTSCDESDERPNVPTSSDSVKRRGDRSTSGDSP